MLPNLTEILDLKTLFKKLCNPIRFGFFEFVEFVQSVIPESSKWRIGDSPAPLGAGFSSVALVQSFQNTLFDNKRLHCYATERPHHGAKLKTITRIDFNDFPTNSQNQSSIFI